MYYLFRDFVYLRRIANSPDRDYHRPFKIRFRVKGLLKKSKDITSTRVCPSCGKAFIWFVETPLSCPYCGYLPRDKRGEGRTALERTFELKLGKKKFTANLLDYSASGVRLSCPERIGMDTLVSIDITELGIHRSARAVWTLSILPGVAMAGFEFI